MPRQIGAAEMRKIGEKIKKEIPGLGFCLLVFNFNEPGISNYLSNANREDMLKGLEEVLIRLRGKQDFKTPEENQ